MRVINLKIIACHVSESCFSFLLLSFLNENNKNWKLSAARNGGTNDLDVGGNMLQLNSLFIIIFFLYTNTSGLFDNIILLCLKNNCEERRILFKKHKINFLVNLSVISLLIKGIYISNKKKGIYGNIWFSISQFIFIKKYFAIM